MPQERELEDRFALKEACQPTITIASPFDPTTTIEAMLPSPHHCWHFRQRKDWDGQVFWNLAQFLEPVEMLEPSLVRRVVQELITHHDALRRRTYPVDGEYYYVFPAPTDHDPVPFTYIDLSDVPADAQRHVLEQHARDFQMGINVIHGPVLQVVLFDLHKRHQQRLLLIVSHTVADGYSFQLLKDDFITLYTQLAQGLTPSLPSQTTALQTLHQQQWAYAQSPEFARELEYWHSLPWHKVQPLPVDFPEQKAANTCGSVATVTATLSVDETAALQRRLPKLKATLQDLLLTAFYQALMHWTGVSTQAFFLTHHGRITPFPEVKLSGTVGNIVATPQLVLDIDGMHTAEETLRTIQEQMRQVPYNGLMWRWLPLEMTLASDLAFNYLGQVHTAEHEGTEGFRHAPESAGPSEDLEGLLWTLLLCKTLITDKQLTIHWEYSTNLYHRATIEQLAHDFLTTLYQFMSGEQEETLPDTYAST